MSYSKAWLYATIVYWKKRCLDRNSVDRFQCYLLGCNFANNNTQRGQDYVLSGSKLIA